MVKKILVIILSSVLLCSLVLFGFFALGVNEKCANMIPKLNGTEGLEYEINSDNQTCSLKSIGNAKGNSIVIASHYEGKVVTEIKANAFKNNATLESVVVPEGVKIIDDNAFYNCTSLKTINFPKRLEKIGSSTFYKCSLLNEVVIPDQVVEIEASAFSTCTSLKSITIGNGVKKIGSFAFYNCTSLTSAEFKNPINWYRKDSAIPKDKLNEKSVAAKSLTSTYLSYELVRH